MDEDIIIGGCGVLFTVGVIICGLVFIFGYVRGSARRSAAATSAAQATQEAEETLIAPTRLINQISLAFQPDSLTNTDAGTGKLTVDVNAIYEAEISIEIISNGLMTLIAPFPVGIDPDNPLSLIDGDSSKPSVQVEINPSTLPGIYTISAQAIRADGQGEILQEDSLNVYVAHNKEDQPYFLITPDNYANYVQQLTPDWKKLPNTNYEVALVLEESDYPQGGQLFVQARGLENILKPEIIAKTAASSGIRFIGAQNLQPSDDGASVRFIPGEILSDETRIFSFPFSLNEQSLEGRYSIELIIEGETTITEKIPVAIKLEQSSLNEPSKWLALEVRE